MLLPSLTVPLVLKLRQNSIMVKNASREININIVLHDLDTSL